MTEEIYNSPKSDVQENTQEVEYHLATTGQRFVNCIIDLIGYFAFSFIVGIILGLTGLLFILDNVSDHVVGWGLMFIYFLFQEAIWGRTLGKLVTKTKVQSLEGGKPSFGQIVGRCLVRFVPFEAFSFLGGEGLPRGWHDAWTKTKVVSLKDIVD